MSSNCTSVHFPSHDHRLLPQCLQAPWLLLSHNCVFSSAHVAILLSSFLVLELYPLVLFILCLLALFFLALKDLERTNCKLERPLAIYLVTLPWMLNPTSLCRSLWVGYSAFQAKLFRHWKKLSNPSMLLMYCVKTARAC